jgi:hypothetical protein
MFSVKFFPWKKKSNTLQGKKRKKVTIYSKYKNIVTYFVEKTDVWLEEV